MAKVKPREVCGPGRAGDLNRVVRVQELWASVSLFVTWDTSSTCVIGPLKEFSEIMPVNTAVVTGSGLTAETAVAAGGTICLRSPGKVAAG